MRPQLVPYPLHPHRLCERQRRPRISQQGRFLPWLAWVSTQRLGLAWFWPVGQAYPRQLQVLEQWLQAQLRHAEGE